MGGVAVSLGGDVGECGGDGGLYTCEWAHFDETEADLLHAGGKRGQNGAAGVKTGAKGIAVWMATPLTGLSEWKKSG